MIATSITYFENLGERSPLVQLAIDSTHTPLAETSQAVSFIPYT